MIIKSKAGNGNKIHVYIDDQYTLTVYDDYWHQNGFRDGEEITEEELASLKEEAGFRLAYEKGLDYLTRRSYAKKELFLKFFSAFVLNSFYFFSLVVKNIFLLLSKIYCFLTLFLLLYYYITVFLLYTSSHTRRDL
jgi:hypothetical protein